MGKIHGATLAFHERKHNNGGAIVVRVRPNPRHRVPSSTRSALFKVASSEVQH